MSWTSPRTWAAGELVTASIMNAHVRDNLSYLISRPGFGTVRDNGADYSTTSGTFTPIDSTYLAGTVTTLAGYINVGFSGYFNTSATTTPTMGFDIQIDGARIGTAAAFGLAYLQWGITPGPAPISVTVRYPVSAGAHVIRPVWYTLDNNGTIFLLAGTTTYKEVLPSFWIQEVA